MVRIWKAARWLSLSKTIEDSPKDMRREESDEVFWLEDGDLDERLECTDLGMWRRWQR
jgi:hypothetical protein